MSELRWALLVAGILLIVALIGWESVKRRRAARLASVSRTDRAVAGEDAEVRASRADLPAQAAGTGGGREPVREPRLVEFEAPEGREPALGDLPIIDPDLAAGAMESINPTDAWAESSARGTTPGTTPAMVLDWPPENERVILALRVVPRAGERFLGAALRQALVGEGFLHGEFAIFHKPLGDGRVIISAASLTRPGSFDLGAMDLGSFAGLNLFAVLPGPLAGREAFERLLLVGRTLSQRLRGNLLDHKGQPLDDARIDELRSEAADIPAA